MAGSEKDLGHRGGPPDIKLNPSAVPEVTFRAGPAEWKDVGDLVLSWERDGNRPPLPSHLFEDPFGVEVLDKLRADVALGLKLSGTTEDDAYLLHNLRSYNAASECGGHIADNIHLLDGRRVPRIVYPASGRDLSVLGMAEKLLESDEIDGVNMVLTEGYGEDNMENHARRFLFFLERYAEIRGKDFTVTETGPQNFVLTVKEKRIEIKLMVHEKNDPVASREELGDSDIVFFHDLEGATDPAQALINTLNTLQNAKANGRVPLLVADDFPRGIWERFGNVVFKSAAAYGHRSPTELTAEPGGSAVEFGGAFQNGLVVQPNPVLLGLSRGALRRYISFAMYAYFISREPPGYEDHSRESFAKKTELNMVHASPDGRDDIEAFAEIANLPQDALSNEGLKEMILPFLRRMEHLLTNGNEPYPEFTDTRGQGSLTGKLGKALGERREAVRGAIQQAEILLLDFLAPNMKIHAFKNHFRLRLFRDICLILPNYPKAMLILLNDEIFVLFLRTLVAGIQGIFDPSAQNANSTIFSPTVMEGMGKINAALHARGMSPLDDQIKEVLLMAHFATRKATLNREIRLFDEAAGIAKALKAAKQDFRARFRF